MAFTLPELPYAYDALEPHIDAETLKIHHGKHHQTYVNNLNAAVEGTEYADWDLNELIAKVDTLPEKLQTPVRNNGGGHANHTFFWESMSPEGGAPEGELAQAINTAFGSFDAFKEAFSKAAIGRFGSGWAWLCVDQDKKLVITDTLNQDSPLAKGLVPLLTVDVWEHAYYLKYQNRRADFVAAFFNVINWKEVARRYAAAR